MAALDRKFAPFLKGAKQDFIKYCESLPPNIRRQKKVDRKLRYYDMLEAFYNGKTIKEVAHENGLDYLSLRNTLAETQYRVEIFSKELTQALR